MKTPATPNTSPDTHRPPWIPTSRWIRSGEITPSANAALISLAVFAFLWAVARAHVQAITGDEGVTFTFFAERVSPSHWLPESNNHVLNSILIRLLTSIFGISHLSMRAPALLGAAVYIAAAYCLVRLSSNRWTLQVPFFICLVYNPFLFDFYVAARGYGMASAFLTCAVALPSWCYLRAEESGGRRHILAAACSSACLALAVAANFSFAFIAGVTGLMLLIWAARIAAPSGSGGWRGRIPLLAAAIVPFLAVTLLLTLYTALHFSQKELHDGGTSVSETVRTAVEASLYRPNPYVLNAYLYPVAERLKGYLLRLLLLAVLFHVLVMLRNWPALRDSVADRSLRLAGVLIGMACLTLFLHHKAYLFFGLLLPRHRTAIWLVPLYTLAAGFIASVSLPSRLARVSRGALIGVLFVVSFYFIGCLRLTYFKEWQYQEDVQRAYNVVAWLNHNRCVKDVEVGWWYHGAMTFYRSASGRESLNEFTVSMDHPPDKQAYVLNSAHEGAFIQQQGLKIVYHGPKSDIVVAVRPEYLDPPAAPCSALPQP